MVKFTSPFSIDLFLANLHCHKGFYRKGIFNYSWRYKTKGFIFQVDQINGKMYVTKIIKRNGLFHLNETIYKNRSWVFGYRCCEYKVQQAFDAMMRTIKSKQKKNENMAKMTGLSYKEANEIINKS